MIDYSLLSSAIKMAPYTLKEFRNVRKRINESLEYKKDVLDSISNCIAPAPIAKEFIIQGGFPSDKIQVIPFGLDKKLISKKSKNIQNKSDKNHLKFGYFGQPLRRKGLHILIDAFCQVPDEYQASLLISTTAKNITSIFHNVKRKKRALYLLSEKIIQIKLNQNDREFYSSMGDVDLAVIPTLYYECCPLVLLEILAHGTPCLVTEGLGMSHIIKPGISGNSFPPRDVNALKAVMVEALRNPLELEKWRNNLYKPYSIKEYINKIKPLIDELVTKRTNI